MLFRQNKHGERDIWVDRGIDDHVDAFEICDPCHNALMKADPRGERWHEGEELCPKCLRDFDAHAVAVDLLGLPRPVNGMLEDRLLTNDEPWDSLPSQLPPRLGCLGADDGLDAGPYDLYLPGKGSALLPDPGDYLLPGIGDYDSSE